MIIFQNQQRYQAIRNEGGHSAEKKSLNRWHHTTDQTVVLLVDGHNPQMGEDPPALNLPSSCTWNHFLRLLRWGFKQFFPPFILLWQKADLNENVEKEHDFLMPFSGS